MKKIFFISIILLIFISYSKQDSTNSTIIRCETNFECIETGCCYNNKCEKTSKCKTINKICYALVGAAGLVIISLNFLYFWFKIKKTRKISNKDDGKILLSIAPIFAPTNIEGEKIMATS